MLKYIMICPIFIFCCDHYFRNVSEWLKDEQIKDIDGKILVFKAENT